MDATASTAGTSGIGARSDHRHGLTTAIQTRLAPATIVADQCVMGNAAGTALEFGTCGSMASEAQIQLIDSLNDVNYTQAETANLSSRFGTGATVYVADLDAEGTDDAEINDLFVFQWRDNPSGVPSDRALGIRINDTGTTLPIRIVDPLTNSLTNKTRADLTRYEFLFLSRQDGVFIQLSALALADVMTRLVPTGGRRDRFSQRTPPPTSIRHGRRSRVAARPRSWRSPTRRAPTSRATRLVVNSAGDAVEFVAPAAPSHQIVNVGRLPDPTVAGSPDLVYLTHDYTEGTKQDMTLTVGFEGSQAGYSDGAYLQDAFGSVNEASPINALFGAGDATSYSLQSVVSFNLNWLEEFTHIEIGGTEYPLNPAFLSLGAYERRIQGNPTGLSAATLTINFMRADGTWYFTDGGDLVHEAGLYEKVGNPPAYHDLAPIEDTHRTGSGNFACGTADPPTAGGQVCIDSDGALWVATNRTLLFDRAPGDHGHHRVHVRLLDRCRPRHPVVQQHRRERGIQVVPRRRRVLPDPGNARHGHVQHHGHREHGHPGRHGVRPH